MSKDLRQKDTNSEVASEEDLIRRMLLVGTPKESFFLLYAKLIEMRCKPNDLTYDGDGMLHMSKTNDEKYVLYLENLWIRCNENRESGYETITSFLKVAEELGKEVPVARETVIPWIKDQEYIELFCRNSEIAYQHFAADLWIVFAAQGEGNSRSVTHQEIDELGISKAEILPMAINNLRRILPEITITDFGAWSLLSAGGDYVPSLLLFDDIWEPMAEKTAADLIAAAPVSDSVFFTSTDSPAGITHIRKRAIALEAEGDHVVSSTLLRRVSGRWKAFD